MHKKNIDHIDTLSKLAKVYGEMGYKKECTRERTMDGEDAVGKEDVVSSFYEPGAS